MAYILWMVDLKLFTDILEEFYRATRTQLERIFGNSMTNVM